MIAAWERFWFAAGPASTLGVCRVVFFLGLCLWHIPLDYSAWGHYPSVLWMPIWLFDRFDIPLLSPAALDVIAIAWKVSLALSAIGLFTRPATIVAFVLGTYLIGVPHNFGQTQHFDTLAVFVLGAFALSRAGRAWSIDALLAAARNGSADVPPPSGEYTWPIRFVWVATALIFCAAGIAKLRHSGLEWIFSDNLALLLRRQQYRISDGEPWTSWGLLVASSPWLAQAMAAVAMTVEVCFALALFSRVARRLLVPSALLFLIGIRALMGPTFEQFIICFVFWVPWSEVTLAVRSRLGERESRLVIYDGGCLPCSRAVVVLTRLDLLHRLRFADAASEWGALSARIPGLSSDVCLTEMLAVTPRGELRGGFEAWRSLAWVLPAGWPVLPLLYLPGVPAIGRRVYASVASHRSTTTCALRVAAAPAGHRHVG